MNTMEAFAMAQANRNKEPKVFDWLKAVSLIKENNAEEAAAGLKEDWECTGDLILKDRLPSFDAGPYLSSAWATPILCIGNQEFDCYKMQGQVLKWNADTLWPLEALQAFEEFRPGVLVPVKHILRIKDTLQAEVDTSSKEAYSGIIEAGAMFVPTIESLLDLLKMDGCYIEWTCHKGALSSSYAIRADLESYKKLNDAIERMKGN
jgi:hypothetical protein